MIRETVLTALALTTACGAPEIGDAPAAHESPGHSTESATVEASPTPRDESRHTDGVGCGDGRVTGHVQAPNMKDTSYWIEALVFGAGAVTDDGADVHPGSAAGQPAPGAPGLPGGEPPDQNRTGECD